MDIIDIVLSKKYTDESLKGITGTLAGKNCTIKSATKVDGVTTVVFAWTADDGTEKTTTIQVNDGADGKDTSQEAVLFIEQKLDDAQRTQARENIGAADAARQNILTGSEIGNPIVVDDAFSAPLYGLTLYGISSQESTTGAQLFDVSNADVVQMYIANSGIGNFSENYSVVVPIKPSTSYTISEKNHKIFRVAITEEYPIESALVLFKDVATVYKNITTPNNLPNGNFLMIQLYGNFNSVPDFSGLMLNEGSTTKPYEPYTGGKPSPSPEYPQEIESAGQDGEIGIEVLGKNLLRIDDRLKKYESNDYVGTSKRIISAGMVAVGLDDVNRFMSNNVSNCVIGNGNITYRTISAGFSVGIGAKLTSGQTYICSYESTNNGRLCLLHYYADGTFWGKHDFIKSNVKFTIPENVVYTVLLFRDADSVGDYKFWDIQLEFGDVATDYEPYKPVQKLIIPTPNGLPGIRVSFGGNYTDKEGQQWVADEIDLARGERVKWIGEYELTGKENVVDFGLRPRVRIVSITMPDAYRDAGNHAYLKAVMSNKYKQDSFSNLTNNINLIARGQQNNIVISIPVDIGIEDFKTDLSNQYASGRPVKVFYKLATPIRTPLPPETIAAYKALHTYSPTTTVINDADAGMQLGYQRDVNISIKKLEDAIASMTTT